MNEEEKYLFDINGYIVVRDVLKARADQDAELVDVRPHLRDRAGRPLPAVGRPDESWAQLWPHRHGTDGMFLALLRRR